jgi:Domain of unknown function (DUF5666)
MTYQDALDTTLSLANQPAELAAYLRTVPAWRPELERAVYVSHSISGELGSIRPDDAVIERSQRHLDSVIANLMVSPSSTPSVGSRLLGVLGTPRIALAGVTAAALLALALVVNFPDLSGGGTQSAEALVIEGNVAEVGAGGVTISTSSSSQKVTLSSDTVLMDGFGNSVKASQLSAGQDVVLQGSRSGEDFVASNVELRDRLFGVVSALPGDSIHLSSSSGDYVIKVSTETHFEGIVNVGDFIEVKIDRNPDGTLLALEVEVEDQNDGDDGHAGPAVEQEHELPGPSSSPVASGPPSASPAPSENQGQKYEDEKDSSHHESEHEDEHEEDPAYEPDD